MYSDDDKDSNEYRAVARAIQNYLRFEYANVAHNIDNDPVPLKISTYSGKGPGHYSTSPDGRPDFTPEYLKRLDRIDARSESDPDLKFGFREVSIAVEQLKIDHPRWYDVIHAVCIENQRIDDVAETLKREKSTIYRYMREGTLYLWRYLLGNRTGNKLAVKIIRIA